MIRTENTFDDLKVAVWDTYVMKSNGHIMHFDIIVPENFKDQNEIYKYGENFVKTKGEQQPVIDSTHCQFCHIEEVSTDISDAIADNGYYIQEMDDIPDHLTENASKRDLVLFIKGHYKDYRFRNFSGVSIIELKQIISNKEKVV